MAGRPKKKPAKLYREIFIELPNQARILFATILILCPVCGSWQVGPNGTHPRANSRVEGFRCENSSCPSLDYTEYGKQFVLTTSKLFQEEVRNLLRCIYKSLLKEGAKNKTIAREYRVSPALISALRRAVEKAIKTHRGLDELVDIPQPDTAVSIDETFIKIKGKTYYIIIATGYKTHKVLGVRVSATRNNEDLRAVFDEAELNTSEPITIVTSDASNACEKMVKILGREMVHIIHRHKKPYNEAVIRHITYEDGKRVINDVGVKTDIFKRRATREFRHLRRTESLQQPAPKKRGRRKDVKNGQGKKKPEGTKKGGRRGTFAIFDRGKKGYVKVNPYRMTLKFSKMCPAMAVAALHAAFSLYPRQYIQNNLAENSNSVLQSIVRLKGQKKPETVEELIRTMEIVRNDPAILGEINIKRNVRSDLFLNNIKLADYGRLAENGWHIQGLEKMEVAVN